MANTSDKSPAGAAQSSRERAEEQSAPKVRLDKDELRDLDAPDSEALKGGIPKRPTGGGD